MALDPTTTLCLADATGRRLGDVSISLIEGDRVHGRFVANEQFDAVREIFEEFEEAVNEQLFREAERLSGEIDELGLYLASGDLGETLQVVDTQIMNGTDLSCRVPNLGITQSRRAAAQAG
jgi:hypothetical protein